MSDRPSWMPSDEEIIKTAGRTNKIMRAGPVDSSDNMLVRGSEPIRRLIERAVLKAQIAEQENWNRCSGEDYHAAGLCIKCGRIKELRDRLAEPEGK